VKHPALLGKPPGLSALVTEEIEIAMNQPTLPRPLAKYVNQTPAVRFVILLAGLAIIVAAMKAAATFLVPILLAVLFAVAFWPGMVSLQKRGMSTGAALTVVLIGFVLVILIIVGIIGLGIGGLADSMPLYQDRLDVQLKELGDLMRGYGFDPGETPQDLSGENTVDPRAILSFVVSGLSQLFTSSFIVFFYVIFMLVEATTIQNKIKAAFSDNQAAYGYVERAMTSLQYYLVIKTRINLITGAFIAVALWLIGLDFALLWGFIAFLLNYVPNFGSIIAAVPAVIMAFIQFGPSIQFLLVIGVYLVVNIAVGYWLEPKMMGSGLGLSALVVLISVVFWGWILGPIGLILSIPITVALKIFLESYDGTRWLATMLGEREP
jgi:predicted PurR-regulated permease PerM